MRKVIFTLMLCFFAVGLGSVSAAAKEYTENGISYEVQNKKAVVVRVETPGEELVIPATLGGFKVTRIGDGAFWKPYKKISLPDTVESIGNRAFYDNEKLRSIRLPSNLKQIKEYAFSGCTALTEVVFNKKLSYIGRYAFNNCISLRKITLTSPRYTLKEGAFYGCFKLRSVSLGNGLSAIGDRAFYKNYDLKSIQIPASVTKVGSSAFERCEDLESVSFKGKKTKLGGSVFSRCISLKKVSLPRELKFIPESLFRYCKNLRSITLPKTATILKKGAFYNCNKLETVKMSSKTYAIGDSTFAYTGLKKMKLSPGMQFIGNGAFRGTQIRNMKLTSKVTFIGNKVFADCKKLKSISIPASVRGINPGAFNNCVSLRSIHVASGNRNYCSQDGVLYNKNKTKLIQYPLHKTNRSFRTPSTLVSIRSNAFSENHYMQSVVVKANKIEEGAFQNMSALKHVTILSGTAKIESQAFAYCSALNKVVLPDSVSVIGYGAFEGSGIATIHIPSSLKKLERNVFSDCRKLKSFEGGKGSRYKVQDGVLYNGSKTTLIKYPTKKAARRFTVPDSVKVVKGGAFDHVSKLTKLEFGKRLSELCSSSISSAKNLKSIVINSRKFYCGYYSTAITGCNRLAVIVGPNTGSMRRLADSANATLITL